MTSSGRVQQAGFTIIEYMVASTVGLILMLVIGGVLIDNLRTADEISSRIALNRHAREIFDLLAFGARQTGANATPIAFDSVFGLRGRTSASPGSASGWYIPDHYMARDGNGTGDRRYRFALPFTGADPDNSGDDELLAEQIGNVTVACSATDVPLQECTVPLQIAGVAGFLRADPDVSKPASAANRVTELTLQLIDPRRLNLNGAYRSDEYEILWTAFWSLVTKVPSS